MGFEGLQGQGGGGSASLTEICLDRLYLSFSFGAFLPCTMTMLAICTSLASATLALGTLNRFVHGASANTFCHDEFSLFFV